MRTALALFVCLVTSTVSAAVGPVPDIATRTRGAKSIVVATVVSVNARQGTNRFGDQLIVSDVLLNVSETLKGSHVQAVTVSVEGGQLGDLTLKVSDLPAMKVGERAVFFLEQAPEGIVPHQRGFGILKLDAADRVEESMLTMAELRRLIQAALK